MNRDSKEKPILSVRVDAELLERLDKLCERVDLGRAEIVERCLAVGLVDEENFVKWLERPIPGAFASLFTIPTVLNALVKLTGIEVDETQRKVHENIRDKRRSKHRRPRTT